MSAQTITAPSPPPPFPLPDYIHPYVHTLVDMVGRDNIEKAVQNALKAEIQVMIDWGIKDADTFLRYASGQLHWLPCENQTGTEIYYTLCLFYFVLDQEPILSMQTAIRPENVDKPMSPVSQWIAGFAVKIGDFMDTPASISEAAIDSFSFEGFHMEEAKPPPGGFKTFNQLFCRRLKDGARPITAPDADSVITWPADSKMDHHWPIDTHSQVHIKGIPWSIHTLLGSSKYRNAFDGGVWMHAFLGPQDYHRQHAPCSGNVVEAKVIQGQCYLEVIVKSDDNGKKFLDPGRSWRHKRQMIERPKKGELYTNEPDAPDEAGYQFLQTRGCIVIDNPVLGLVAFLPIGMAYVSSVKLSVKDIYDTGAEGLPSYVRKGDEVSCFQFGGSDFVMVFQKKAGVNLDKLNIGQHYKVGELFCEANPLQR